MIRKVGLALIVIAVLWLGGRALVRALASDETKIRWALDAACEGFGDTRMNPILDVLAPDFRDETSGFARADVREAIAAAFFQEKDPATKGFPYRIEIPPSELEIKIEKSAPAAADVAFHALVVDTRNSARRVAWEFRLTGRMEARDQGWCFVRVEHRTVNGSFHLR